VIQYVIRRILWSIPVLFLLTLTVFLLMRAIPGGPFDFSGDKKIPDVVRQNLERRYHLDEPTSTQFVRYLVGDFVDTRDIRDFGKDGLLRGDLGLSLRQRGRTVNEILGDSFPISAQLGVLSMMLAIFIGIPAGILAALKQNSWIDYSSTFVAVLGVSIPNMVMGPLLIWAFALKLNWFPVATWGAQATLHPRIPACTDSGFLVSCGVAHARTGDRVVSLNRPPDAGQLAASDP